MDEFFLYDQAMLEFCKVTLPNEANNIPILFATGSRAFERIKFLYQEINKRKITLPVMALMRTEISPNFDRWRFHPRMKVAFVDDQTKNELKVARSPNPIFISYTLDVRAILQTTLNFVKKQIFLRFLNNLAYVEVDLSDYGIQKIKIMWEGYSALSELEPGEGPIKLRDSASFLMDGWVFHDTTTVKALNMDSGGKIIVQFCDDSVSPEEFLEQIEYTN